MLRGGLPSEIALQGEASSPNFVSRGRCTIRKNPTPPWTPLAVNATYVIWIKSESYYEKIPGLASSQLLCRLLSSKNDPVIKYACMQIRVLLCTESGTTVSLNWNELLIKSVCMLTRYNCALNRELLCFDIQTCMKKGNNCVSHVQSCLKVLVGYANCISFLIITCLLLLHLVCSRCYVLLVDR